VDDHGDDHQIPLTDKLPSVRSLPALPSSQYHRLVKSLGDRTERGKNKRIGEEKRDIIFGAGIGDLYRHRPTINVTQSPSDLHHHQHPPKLRSDPAIQYSQQVPGLFREQPPTTNSTYPSLIPLNQVNIVSLPLVAAKFQRSTSRPRCPRRARKRERIQG
jgi:hypothetical protein